LRSSPFRVRTPNARRKSRTATKNKTLIFSLKLAKQKTLSFRPSVSKKNHRRASQTGFSAKEKEKRPDWPERPDARHSAAKTVCGQVSRLRDFGFWILDFGLIKSI
jgi:hypothetical protein